MIFIKILEFNLIESIIGFIGVAIRIVFCICLALFFLFQVIKPAIKSF